MKAVIRLVLATAVAGSAVVIAAPAASATDCSQKPSQCSGACHVDTSARDPRKLVVCYA